MQLHTKGNRPAIAMIELIFAITVMGIVMLSVPQLLSVSSNSGYASIQQEGINEAASQANIMLGYHWDESNTIVGPVTVLNTNGVAELNGTLTLPKRRVGTPPRGIRNFVNYHNQDDFNASAIGYDTNETTAADIDDIDDFSGTSTSLVLDGSSTTKDYIEKTTINISRNVAYMSDAETGTGTYANAGGSGILTFKPTFTAVANSTNIKYITVTLTSTSDIEELNSTSITLSAFSCNIGSYELGEK